MKIFEWLTYSFDNCGLNMILNKLNQKVGVRYNIIWIQLSNSTLSSIIDKALD